MPQVLGIDISTTATKAVLVDETGAVRAIGITEYGFEVPHPLWSEQAPQLWWDATIAAVRQVLASPGVTADEVVAVGLTGQMHGAVLLDAADEVLRPAILWNDQRTSAECELIREVVGRERLIAVTGNDALTGFTAPKLVWVREREPDVWRRIAHVLLPKDYVRLRLTGDHAVDKADGAGTLLFDLARRDWSPEVVAALDIDPRWLPRSWEGPQVTGSLLSAAAEATGLRPGTPVVAGGGDQSANAVGVGVVSPGSMALSLGTSGVVFAATAEPLFEPLGRVHAFCHAVPERWHMMSVMLSAAGSLRWFRDAVAPAASYTDLVEPAGEIPPGSDGLDLMLAAGTPRPRQIRVSGGGTASSLWRQILADVLDAEIATVSTSEGAAYGAAVLAAVGGGWHPGVEEACAALVTATPSAEPGTSAALYREAHAIYRDLYPALKPTFDGALAPPGRGSGR